jgi:hypothetical protein
MKILMIQTIVSAKGYIQMFGLGDDNKIYKWNYQNASWVLFKKGDDSD